MDYYFDPFIYTARKILCYLGIFRFVVVFTLLFAILAFRFPAPARALVNGALDPGFVNGVMIGPDYDINSLAVQPDGKILIGGAFTNYNGVAKNDIARINTDLSLDTGFSSISYNGNSSIKSIAIQSDGKVLLGGIFGGYIDRRNSDGTDDTTFLTTGAGVNGNTVYSLALQTDGKILIGGAFTTYNGVARGYVARLNADGSLDSSFLATGAGANGVVNSLVVQSDGKILIGGAFTTYNGVARGKVARLNSDGSLDTTFLAAGAGASGTINSIAVQPDGKILIGGAFAAYNGVARGKVARLNTDGSLDTTFLTTGAGASSTVNSIAIQSDGKILIGGAFTTYNGVARGGVARLNADGSLDTTFLATGAGASGTISSIVVQSDGKILIGGDFTRVNAVNRGKVARLNTDGSLDATFLATGAGVGTSGVVYTIAVQPDGKILIGGDFTRVNAVKRGCIARLNTDGSLDTGFLAYGIDGAGASGPIFTLAIQSNGAIWIGGDFVSYTNNRPYRPGLLVELNRDYVALLSSSGDTYTDDLYPPTGTNDIVNAIAIQSDGRILIGGLFTSFISGPVPYITRLMWDVSAPIGGSISYTNGYQTNTSVTLAVADGTDALSGVDTTSRVTQRKSATLTGGICGSFGTFSTKTTTGTYPSFIDSTVTTGNCYQYQYKAYDNVGNVATYTSTSIIQVDTDAPSTGSISYTDGYYTIASVPLTVADGIDAASGLNTSTRITERKSAALSAGTCGSFGSFSIITPTGTYPNFTDATVATGNCYQYQYKISDNAGNQVTYINANVAKVDTIVPVTSDNTDSSWHNVSVNVNFSCSDADSDCAATYYTTDGTTPTTGSTAGTSFSLSSTETYTIKYFSVDAAGNTESVKTATNTVKIDTGAPTDPGTPSTTTPTNSTSQTWIFTAATDAVSGVANYLWRTTGAAIASGTSAVNSIATSLTQGFYNFFVKSVDTAGNTSNESTSAVNVDTSAPVTSDNISTSWNNSEVTITLSCGDDTGSGCATTYYTTNGDIPTTDSTAGTSISLSLVGTYTIKYFSVDAVGNTETVKTAANTVKIETTAPAGGSISYTSGYYTTASVALTVTDGTDATSGLNTSSRITQRKSATLSAGTCGSFGSFATITPTGTYPNLVDTTVATNTCYQYQYTISDNAGNQATYINSNVVKVDTTAPVTTDNTDSSWHNVSVDVDFSCSDAGSDCAATYFTTDGSDPTLSSPQGIITTFPSDGVYTVKYFSVDHAGNAETIRTAGHSVKIDVTPPFTTDDIDAFWHNSAVLVNLLCVDGEGSGCTNTYYTTNGSIPTTSSSQGNSFTLSSIGSYIVKYFSIDVALNTEGIKTAENQVRIETTAPSGGSISYTDGYQTAASVALTVSDGTDATSGINPSSRITQRKSATLSAGTCGSFGSFATITPTGTYPNLVDSTVATGNCYEYQYKISDYAGNQVTYTSTNIVKVDTGAPTDPGTPSTTTPTNSTSQTWTFTAATDAVSGVANYLWRTTGTAITSGTSAVNSVITSLTEGIYNFFVKSVDNAGNSSTESTSSATVDTTAPVTTDNVSASWSNSTVNITLSCSDNSGSGCVTTYYTTDGTTPNTGSTAGTSFSLSSVGTYTIKYFSVDAVGNTETVKTAANQVKIETTSPSTGSISYTNGYQTTASVALTVSDGTDSDSGLNTSSRITQRKSATLSAGTCGSFGSFSIITPSGTYPNLVDSTVATGTCYQYQYKISDNAGNQVTYINSNVVKVDAAAPITIDNVSASWSNTTVDVTLSCSDTSGSGCATTYYTTDGTTPTTGSTVGTSISLSDVGTYIIKYFSVDVAGNAETVKTAINTVKIETTTPTTGYISYINGYETNSSVVLAISDGTDSDSGLNTSSRITERKSAALSAGACGSFGSFSTITPSGTYPNFTDSTVTTGTCYQYQYKISDNANNQVTYTNSNVVKVDTEAPSDPGTPSTTTPTNSTSQTWTFTAATDAVSGVASYLWRTTGAAITSGTSAVNTIVTSLTEGIYSFFVKGEDSAGNEGSESTSSLMVDTTAPAGGSISYVNGSQKTTSVALTANDGTDTASGLETSSRVVQRKSAALSDGTCGTFGIFESISPTGTYPNFVDATGVTGNCYQYQYKISDTVTNQATYTSANIVKIDTAAPITTDNTDSSWHNTIVTIALSCSDTAGSGCTTTYYTTNGDDPTLSSASGTSVVLSSSGTYTIKYLSVDEAGNTESVKTATNLVKVDITAPSDPGTPSTTTPTNSTTQTWTFTAATDAVSGVANYLWRTTGTAITSGTSAVNSIVTSLTEGIYNFFVKGVDTAGNEGSESTSEVTVDTTAPIATLTSSDTSSSSATINWTSDEESSTQLEYGLTDSYGSTTSKSNVSPRANSHTVSLSSLTTCSTYHYHFLTEDALTNTRASTDGTFTTSGCTSEAPVISESDIQATVDLGGTLDLLEVNDTGLSLSIPPDYSTQDAVFQAHQLDVETVIAETALPTGFTSVGTYMYELKAQTSNATIVSTFVTPLTISITYEAGDITTLDESSLTIWSWNGSTWTQLTDCVVDTLAKTVTCSTNHFSVFGLFGITKAEDTSSVSVTSSPTSSVPANSASSCGDSSPVSVSDLFQIDVTGNTAKLFFAPIVNINTYNISYSTKASAEEHGTQVTLAKEGVQNYTISLLKPNTTYYFKVRGQNGCMPGGWSNIMKIVTKAKGTTRATPFYKGSLIKSIFLQSQRRITTFGDSILKTVIKPQPILTPSPEIIKPVSSPPTTPTPQKKCFLWWCW
jgi:uncharacterized delta-60 repeat protein